MPRFADIVDEVTSLSTEELEEIRMIINRVLIEKKRESFVKAYQQSLQDSKDGKLFSSNNIEEIAKWLNSDE
jgi:hypothetical protein